MDEFNTPAGLVHKLPSFLYDFNDLASTRSDKFIVELSPFLEEFKKAYDTAQGIRYGDYVSNNSVGSFFRAVKAVLKKSQELRKQEMPDYNVFNILRISTREVVATAMWKDFLDPKGSHEQGDLFLHPFLELLDDKLKCMGENFHAYDDLPVNSWITSAEEFVRKIHAQDKDGRIDVYLKHMSAYSAIAIEYKIDAGDQEKQVSRYYRYLEAQRFNSFHVVYISPAGEEPTEPSLKGLNMDERKKVVCMSIRYELVPMLNRVLKTNNQIPKELKYFIENYIEVAAK